MKLLLSGKLMVPGMCALEYAAFVRRSRTSFFAASGQLAMTRAFRDLSVAEGSLMQILVPLGIATGGVLFFSERFTLHELVGGALILGGTAVTALRQPTRANAEAE